MFLSVQVPASDCEVARRGQPDAEAAVGLPEVGRHGCEALCCCRDNSERCGNASRCLLTLVLLLKTCSFTCLWKYDSDVFCFF